MKKLIIVCTIMVMVLAMAMPCFANEYIKGSCTFNDFVDISPYATTSGQYIPMSFTHEGIAYSGVRLFTSFGGYYMYFVPADGDENLYAYYQPAEGMEGLSHEWRVSRTIFLDSEYPSDLLSMLRVWGTVTLPVKVDTFIEWKENFKEQISVDYVVEVLVVLVGATVGLVFMWWGVRKFSRAVFSAFRKGKISV